MFKEMSRRAYQMNRNMNYGIDQIARMLSREFPAVAYCNRNKIWARTHNEAGEAISTVIFG